MRQHMPGTHTEPEVARRYAAGEVGFEAIAEDMGPRKVTTLDILLGGRGASRTLRKVAQERSAYALSSRAGQSAAQRRSDRFVGDASAFERSLSPEDPNAAEAAEHYFFGDTSDLGHAPRRAVRR